MKISEFVEKVREKLGHNNFYQWNVEHLQKAGVIQPVRKGRGRPREFDKEDIKKAVEFYTCREK